MSDKTISDVYEDDDSITSLQDTDLFVIARKTGSTYTSKAVSANHVGGKWGNVAGTLENQTDLQNALDDKANTADLSEVATSGDYADLLNIPTIPNSLDDLSGNSDVIAEGTSHLFMTSTERSKLSDTSGTNTGDQDLSGLVPTTRTVNSKALSSNVTLTQDDVGDGTTYKQYSATEKTKLAAISGTNTGDQTIPTTLPPTGTASGDLSGTYPNPSVVAATLTTAGKVRLREYNVRDYGAVCDGSTDDTTAIQSALDAAAANGGGTVFLPSTAVVSNLKIDSYVQLTAGSTGAMLLAKTGSTGYMISLKTPASSERVIIRDITLKPNVGTLGGINLDNTGYGTSIDPLHLVENVVVLNAGGDAFHFDNSMRELRVLNCYAHYPGGHGFYVGSGCTDSRFVSCTVGPSTNHAYEIVGNNNNFIGCKAFYAGFNGSTWATSKSGFYINGSAYSTFSNCSAQQNSLHGYDLHACSRVTLVGCEADTNSAGTTGGVGFNTSYATYCIISACTGANNGILSPGNQTYGIQVDGTQTGTTFIGNTVTGSSGTFGYVSGFGYFLLDSTIADLSGIPTKLNDVTQFALAGSSSGSTAIAPAATASGTWTLPATTDTFVGRATADTMSNKTHVSPVISTSMDARDAPITGGSTADVIGTALAVTRNAVQVGRIDNNSSGLRVQAQAGVLQLRGSGNNGMSVASTGGVTFDSTVTLNADPSAALQAATKQYVDVITMATVVASGAVDMNNYVSNGFYIFTTGATLTNAPSTNGYMTVISGNTGGTATQSDNVKQIWYRMGTNGTNDMNTWVRSRNANSWGTWSQFAMTTGFTMNDAGDITLGTTTGTRFGTSTTQKLGFYGNSAAIQPGNTTDLGLVLSNLGLRGAGTAYFLTTSGTTSLTGQFATGTGGFRSAAANRTANTSLSSTSAMNESIDATGGSITITLSAANSTTGQMFIFWRKDNSANTVTIQRTGTDTINGVSTSITLAGYKSAMFLSDSTSNWMTFLSA